MNFSVENIVHPFPLTTVFLFLFGLVIHRQCISFFNILEFTEGIMSGTDGDSSSCRKLGFPIPCFGFLLHYNLLVLHHFKFFGFTTFFLPCGLLEQSGLNLLTNQKKLHCLLGQETIFILVCVLYSCT